MVEAGFVGVEGFEEGECLGEGAAGVGVVHFVFICGYISGELI